MTGYIRNIKPTLHTVFKLDTKERLCQLEKKMNEIIDTINELSEKVRKLEG